MMAQNTSSAVMQQRKEPHSSLDDFPTPPWATRALCEWMAGRGEFIGCCDPDLFLFAGMTCREPAANRGHMVRALREYFEKVEASDIHDYGAGFEQRDYLFGPISDLGKVDWTITNPPFRLAEQFIARALETSERGVAVFVRSAFLEGAGRYERLFSQTPPAIVLQFTERVVLHRGRLSEGGSSATAYSWLVFRPGYSGPTRFQWIHPCRRQLERAEDYPDSGMGVAQC